MPKRRKIDAVEDAEASTPRKSRRTTQQDESLAATPSQQAETPSGRKSILRGTPSKVNGVVEPEATPKSLRKVLFSTPSKPADAAAATTAENGTPSATRNDHSARRKSARALQKQVLDDASEDEDDEQDMALAKEILDEEESEEGSDQEDDEEVSVAPSSAATTPSKKRGRPKGKRRERTPSPPPNLPPHELYFFQNRTGGNKTSSNTFSSNHLLNHEDFLKHISAYKDPHDADIKRLIQYHKRAFDQWIFELEQGYNICLYGYGSKRQLAMDFAEHMYSQAEKSPKTVVVNGYAPGLTIRDVLTTIAGAVLPKGIKLPAQPAALLDLISTALSSAAPPERLQLIIHSLDHANFRKSTTQNILASLASHPRVSLLATCDTLNFPLLWDTTLLRQYRWLYHDATTFQPYSVEIDVVEEVGALLGRRGRRVGGKDGVGFVLKSLPENARNLFRILVGELLAGAEGDGGAVAGAAEDDVDEDEMILEMDDTPSRRGRKPKIPKKVVKPAAAPQPTGVEYRTLYHKAVEEFVCSSELNFRTLLKEFHDHQIIESSKDAMGTERLNVPFRWEELEGILEELV